MYNNSKCLSNGNEYYNRTKKKKSTGEDGILGMSEEENEGSWLLRPYLRGGQEKSVLLKAVLGDCEKMVV